MTNQTYRPGTKTLKDVLMSGGLESRRFFLGRQTTTTYEVKEIAIDAHTQFVLLGMEIYNPDGTLSSRQGCALSFLLDDLEAVKE